MLLSFTGIGVVFVMGYLVHLFENIYTHQKGVLPSWKDRKELFIDGLLPFFGLCLYGLPLFMGWGFVVLPYLFLGGVLLPLLFAGYLWRKQNRGRRFPFRAFFQNINLYLFLLGVEGVVLFSSLLIGVLTFGIGVFFTLFWGLLVFVHLLVQWMVQLEGKKYMVLLRGSPHIG